MPTLLTEQSPCPSPPISPDVIPHPMKRSLSDGEQISSPPLKKCKPPAIVLPSSDTMITPEQIQRCLDQIEFEEAAHYISESGWNLISDKPVLDVLKKRYEGAIVTLNHIKEGQSYTKIVQINGVSQFVLKKLSLPYVSDWNPIIVELLQLEGPLEERLRTYFSQTGLGNLDYPYINKLQREKLATIFCQGLGIPNVELLKTGDGMYGLHEYVPDSQSAKAYGITGTEALPLEHVQEIALIDILLENIDRHLSNILVTTKDKNPSILSVVPIDHELIFQHRDFQTTVAVLENSTTKILPCWLSWKCAQQPLTKKTKKYIASLNPKVLITNAHRQGLILDQKVISSIAKNIAFLQHIIQTDPHVSTSALYHAFLDI